MAYINMRWQGNGIAVMSSGLDGLEGGKALVAFRRALNHTGNKTFTVVKRSLARQVGVSQAVVMKRGNLRKKLASNSALEYRIISRGDFMPLKDFKPNQQRKGVKASPWGTRRVFPSTFIVSSIGGHVFKRVGKARLPIEKVWGPAIPREMARDETRAAFHATVKTALPRRIQHEINHITRGIFR